MPIADAPRTELGTPGGIAPAFSTGSAPGAFYVEGLDANPDLRFPLSANVYDRMRREDGQVISVMRAITHPIIATRWRLVGTDVRPEVMRFLESELGLTADDQGRARRRRQGIVWREHLREALLMLPFGFMPFEPVFEVAPASPGLEDPADPGRLYAHLRKLAPRFPRTVREVRVGRDGGLAGIVQEPMPGTANPNGTFIPVDRLVMYVNEREGADWTGTSVLRGAYKHWLIKDALIRLGAQVVERNGMGIPIVTWTDEKDEARALKLAASMRAGAEAGGAVRAGMAVNVVGVEGSTADGLPWVKYHDESIGRSLLAMFLNLGHDNGARALGATFVDYFLLFLEGIIAQLEETATEHVIRDLVEHNFGPDEPYPMLKADKLAAESTPTAEALAQLADAGILTPDRELENDVRRRNGLPSKPEPVSGDETVEDAASSAQVSQVGIPALIAAGVITADEGRTMLKLPGSAPIPAAATVPVALPPAPAIAQLSADEGRALLRQALGLPGTPGEGGLTVVVDDGPVTHTPAGVVPIDAPDYLVRLESLAAKLAAQRVGHPVG
jgi:hypothetical protein